MRVVSVSTALLCLMQIGVAQARIEREVDLRIPRSEFSGWPVSQADPPAVPTPPQTPATPAPDGQVPAPEDDILPNLEGGGGVEDELSVGEIPSVEVIELKADQARKSIDAYILVREKYKDAELENYENLQDFVDQNAQGKAFETDIKSFGFANVNDWNIAITTIGITYANIINDQTADIRQQIEEVKADTEMAKDMVDRMVAALSVMIPSDNNRKVVDDLIKDAAYGDKLKLLEAEEEE